MAGGRRVNSVVVIGGILCLWTAGRGGPSLWASVERGNDLAVARTPGPLPMASSAGVLAPYMTVAWSVESAGSTSGPLCGQSTVGARGWLQVGPYGSVPVAGLTLDQARTAIERQVGSYVTNPKVGLRALVPVAPADSDRPIASRQSQPVQGGGPVPDKTVTQAAWQATSPLPASGPPANAESRPPTPLPREITAPPPAAPPPPPAPGPVAVQPVRPDLPGTVVASQWRPVQRINEPSGRQAIRAASATGPALAEVPGTVTNAVLEPGLPAEELHPPRTTDMLAPGEGPLLSAFIGAGVPHPPVPRECAKVALPPYVIEPPDILLIETAVADVRVQPVRGQHLVRPDGTVSLGIYGNAFVGGLTLEQAKVAIGQVLAPRLKDFKLNELNVDVLAYNSKFYYIITDGAGYGQQLYRLPITGSDTVLDAIAQIGGLPAVASKKVWLARRTCSSGTGAPEKLPVNWTAITCGATDTNYQVLPGDRIFVCSDRLIRLDSALGKFLAPIERVFGAVLLGSETVNSIKSGGTSGTGGSTTGR
jgi:polysaccharide export outer membrane protein